MRFDRGLRFSLMKPYPAGYDAPSTADINPDHPIYEFGNRVDQGRWLDDQSMPSSLELKVSLRPVWVKNDSAVVQLDNNISRFLYKGQNVFSRVCLEYSGAGYYQNKSGSEKIPFIDKRFLDYDIIWPGQYLYEKEFAVQPVGQSIRWITQWVKEPDGKDHSVYPLWAYGGQQQEKDIHPCVFSLDALRGATQISVGTLLQWQKRGVFPDQPVGKDNKKLTFADKFTTNETHTLIQSVEAGLSVIFLSMGIDDQGKFAGTSYISYRFENGYIFYRKEKST